MFVVIGFVVVVVAVLVITAAFDNGLFFGNWKENLIQAGLLLIGVSLLALSVVLVRI